MTSNSSGGFCYAVDVSPNQNNNHQSQFAAANSNQIQDFHDQIFNNNSNNNNNNANWQENSHSHSHNNNQNQNLIFSCEGNERPSQGLSLTLSSNNPSAIGIQTFELRNTAPMTHYNHHLLHHHHHHNHDQSTTSQPQFFQLRGSKFLTPAQELLNEFCSLGTSLSSEDHHKQKSRQKSSHWGLLDHHHNNQESNNNIGASGSSSSKKSHSLYSLEFLELQKRKTKLLSMLEEVERRYKKYCEQMRGVTSSFETAAGPGSSEVYSALASKAMSRHFRCLKDGISAQIEATRRAMGDDVAAAASTVPGTTRGETPRLRAIDQAVRQQRAFQQMSLMESHPWRPQRGLPERSVSVLRAWLFEHFLHPYPSDVDKHILARQTGLSRSQVSNWFINARVRLWKPMVEEMYIEETKEAQSSDHHHHSNAINMTGSSSDPTTTGAGAENTLMSFAADQKPGPDQLVRILDSDQSLSSVVLSDKSETLISHVPNMQLQQQSFGRFQDSYAAAMSDLDFSSYAPPQPQFPGTGVSLTLGLQQHAGAVSHSHHHHHHHHQGVSLAFSPGSQSSMFYPRSSSENHHHHHQNSGGGSNMDDQVPAVQYSLMDGDQGQNLPYRNLMGAQLLHDLA